MNRVRWLSGRASDSKTRGFEPRKRGLPLKMPEKLLTGTLNKNKSKHSFRANALKSIIVLCYSFQIAIMTPYDLYLVVLVFSLQQCGIAAVIPPYLPPISGLSRLQLILAYYDKGFSNSEILILLFVYHGFKLCRKQLHRILKQNKRRRRLQYSPDEQVVAHMLGEMEFSGQCVGYRSMWQRLVVNHNLKIPRDEVLTIMRLVDPVGIEMRKAHRLKRRQYYARGPNFIWHVDGHDKLKPYGFCIHVINTTDTVGIFYGWKFPRVTTTRPSYCNILP